MDSERSLTALEVSELLKINKNTVYELVKRGELPGYKIGKKLRIDEKDVFEYINNQKSSSKNSKNITKSYLKNDVNINSEFKIENDIIISGQDIILDVLARHIEEKTDNIRVLRSNVGSYTSLYDLYNDKISISSSHLWDGDTNEYNTAYVRRLIPGIPCILINLAYRRQGFYVAKGNPHNITTWDDLIKSDISIVNREKGSGTRVLLDEKLRLYNVEGESIKGYNFEQSSHLAVASSIAVGDGDLGIGIEKVAHQVSEIDFVPIQEERYDLIIKKSFLKYPLYKLIIEIIQSKEFKKEIKGLGEYDLRDTGKILAET
ncbi:MULTISPECIES: helix-turn-helix transcriptional regulator [Clostridium]|uniref:DNA binding domain, excisionase family n=1 Tax=Clostridium botulinum (strain Eklund 17B / Type B) TaxID=935198 RepID=B2TPV3_CLOBB|nr:MULTISPECIES: helix-turn-helix transcriptional regulator [Clostridium]ACD24454.1 DNA binding domain, excisionase family [Clostridium botulinum B str. Eklund 17B (NRP)]MBN1046469.1 helix-turn-helix domain-containing protein [Clostridium botulinum]MBN1056371.1 helix-turn-helix domain-containing protein [Clostridium botulinum]MBY6975414.1 helix-turn-helix transcriptional regulator [Clostridium botulinum]MBY7000963.1 helix-turn-helix transcriptional regulator [Clostridium botulinum]